MYLYILSRELALTCFSVTVLLWLVALRYGAFTRKAQRAYQDGLAETNEVLFRCSCLHFLVCVVSAFAGPPVASDVLKNALQLSDAACIGHPPEHTHLCICGRLVLYLHAC